MHNNLVISFLLNRLSYAALMAKEATKEQSDTTVCRSNKQHVKIYNQL